MLRFIPTVFAYFAVTHICCPVSRKLVVQDIVILITLNKIFMCWNYICKSLKRIRFTRINVFVLKRDETVFK
jgi:hypothetical protein